MGNHFLLMICSNETISLRPSFPTAADAVAREKSKAHAARLSDWLDFHGRGKKWTVEKKEKQKRNGGEKRKRNVAEKKERRTRSRVRRALPSLAERNVSVRCSPRGVLGPTSRAIQVIASAVIFVLSGHLRLAAKVAAEMVIAIPHVLTFAVAASMFASHWDLLENVEPSSFFKPRRLLAPSSRCAESRLRPWMRGQIRGHRPIE